MACRWRGRPVVEDPIAIHEARERAWRRMQRRLRKSYAKRDIARLHPCSLGEELCVASSEGPLTKVRRLLDSVSLLLERGADANTMDPDGMTVMHFAAMRGGSVLGALLEAGADVNVRDENGGTPLHWAALGDDEDVVHTLLEAGADGNLKGWDGRWRNRAPTNVCRTVVVRELIRRTSRA